MGDFLAHVGGTNLPSLALGGGALLALVAGRIWLRNKPVSLFVVVGGIAIASFVDLGGYGVKLLGEVPRGIALRLVDARSSVREMLRAEGVEERFGRLDRSMALTDVIDAFLRGDGVALADAAREAAGPPDRIPGGTPASASADHQGDDTRTGGPSS